MSGDSSSLDPPPEASSNPTQSSTGETSLPADIRQQVEQEQALADAQKRLKALEADNERIKQEKKDVEDARDGAGARFKTGKGDMWIRLMARSDDYQSTAITAQSTSDDTSYVFLGAQRHSAETRRKLFISFLR